MTNFPVSTSGVYITTGVVSHADTKFNCLVLTASQFSFDTFMALGADRYYHYIYVDSPEIVLQFPYVKVRILSDFFQHPLFNEILDVINEGLDYRFPAISSWGTTTSNVTITGTSLSSLSSLSGKGPPIYAKGTTYCTSPTTIGSP